MRSRRKLFAAGIDPTAKDTQRIDSVDSLLPEFPGAASPGGWSS